MSVTQDIVATYRGPRKVVRKLLAPGRREDLALLFVLFGSIILFIANAPYQSREAHFDDTVPLQARLYWSAMFWIFIVPFAMYLVGLAVWGLSKLAGRKISNYAVRLTLFIAVTLYARLAISALEYLRNRNQGSEPFLEKGL